MPKNQQNKQPNHTPPKMTTRRGFFQAWATSWGSALKTATHNEDYPLEYNGLSYQMVESGGLNTLIFNLAAWPVEFPDGLSFCQFDARHVRAERGTKKLVSFCKENAITHLLWDCDLAPKGALPPCPAIILNAPDDFTAKQPCLFLFTEDQALTKGDTLGQIVRNQSVSADLYVGRLQDDLTDAESPTWQRLQLFINET